MSTFDMNQRGTGRPQPREKSSILRHIGDENAAFISVKLTPGKYDWDGKSYGAPRMCYKEFSSSVAQLVNQFTDFNEYLGFKGQSSLNRMYLVMDEFSGYSMFTIAALVGFGFDRITSVLCYFRGNYTSFNLYT